MVGTSKKIAMCSAEIVFLILLINFVFGLQPILEIDIAITPEDKVIYDNTRITFGGESQIVYNQGNYKIVIYDVLGKEIFSANYQPYFLIQSNPPMKTDYAVINEKVEYREDMFVLKILHNDKPIYVKYLDFCNKNGVCEDGENYISCKEDCPLDKNDGMCINEKDFVCDPDCLKGEDPDCNNWLLKFSSIIFFIFVILLIFSFRAPRKFIKKEIKIATERFKYALSFFYKRGKR